MCMKEIEKLILDSSNQIDRVSSDDLSEMGQLSGPGIIET